MSNRQDVLAAALLLAAGYGVVGCASDPKPEAQQPGDTAPTHEHDVEPAKPMAAPDPMPTTAPSAAPVDMANEKLTDDQIVGVAVALNQGEIDQAAVEQKSGKAPKAKALAQHMSTEHTAWLKQGGDLAKKEKITPADSPVATKLKSDSSAVVSTLQGLKGADLDKAYVDAQVKGHQDALDVIDKKLLASVTNSALKDLLTTVRGKVAEHLKHAQEVQSGLAAAPAGPPATGGKPTK